MSTPAAWLVTAALWSGCLLPGPWLLAPAGAAVLVVARWQARASVRTALTVLALVAVGSGVAGARGELAQRGPLVALAEAGGQARLAATVVTEARPTQTGAWLLLRIATVDGVRAGQRALLRVVGFDAAPPIGARVAFVATARPLDAEGFDAHLRRLHAVAAVTPVSGIAVVQDPPS